MFLKGFHQVVKYDFSECDQVELSSYSDPNLNHNVLGFKCRGAGECDIVLDNEKMLKLCKLIIKTLGATNKDATVEILSITSQIIDDGIVKGYKETDYSSSR